MFELANLVIDKYPRKDLEARGESSLNGTAPDVAKLSPCADHGPGLSSVGRFPYLRQMMAA